MILLTTAEIACVAVLMWVAYAVGRDAEKRRSTDYPPFN